MHGFGSHCHFAFIVMYATHMQDNNNITGSCQGCESDARHSVNDLEGGSCVKTCERFSECQHFESCLSPLRGVGGGAPRVPEVHAGPQTLGVAMGGRCVRSVRARGMVLVRLPHHGKFLRGLGKILAGPGQVSPGASERHQWVV